MDSLDKYNIHDIIVKAYRIQIISKSLVDTD